MATRRHLRVKSRHGYVLAGELHLPDGKGPFPLVILSHGYGSSKESKKGVVVTKALEDKYACLRLDFAGHGESGGDFDGTTVTRCAEDVEDLLAALKGEKAVDRRRLILYGSSLGGAVSILLASRHPETKAMLLFAPASDFTEQEGACKAARGRGEKGIPVNFRRYGAVLIHCALAEDGATHDFYALAEKVRCPAIIFHGDEDEVIPLGHSRKLQRALRDGHLVTVKGADHDFNGDRELCARLAQDCRKFLDAHPL